MRSACMGHIESLQCLLEVVSFMVLSNRGRVRTAKTARDNELGLDEEQERVEGDHCDGNNSDAREEDASIIKPIGWTRFSTGKWIETNNNQRFAQEEHSGANERLEKLQKPVSIDSRTNGYGVLP